ncbi:hypothetical protein [uncultured Paludibaculum sp.]|uniref:hypothetical protein n=1 Tax=uncultured Paludibaculum sp. TaxID=1765020 RepID=UPI002AAB9A25|nr:hypothetical protein [uncultured Paludibaculum sp.]
MGLKYFTAATVAVAAIFLSSCSEAPSASKKAETEAKKEPAKPAEAIAARVAYFEMYKTARTWAPDLLTLTLKSGEVPNIKNEGGKAGVWTAVFVSPSKKEARTFSYAVADDGADIHKGLNISDKLVWNGATPNSKAFTNGEFLIDSDAAFKTISEKAEPWLKAHPGEKATISLGSTSRFPAPVWYIMWGTAKNGYFGYVNATTGAIVTQ